MTRQLLRTICRALVGVVLFAQLAVSAYACPGLPSAASMKLQMNVAAAAAGDLLDAVATPNQQAPNCEDMAGPTDPEFANLCAEHCHHGQQSDQASTVTVPAALLNALYYVTPLAPEPVVAPRPAAHATSALVAASPTLAILHCCFRI